MTLDPVVVGGSTVSPTKATASWVTIPEMSISVTPRSSSIDVTFDCSFLMQPAGSGATCQGLVRLAVDGAPVAGTTTTIRQKEASLVSLVPGDAVANLSIARRNISGLTPGVSVTVTAEWSATNGTIEALGTERSLRVDRS